MSILSSAERVTVRNYLGWSERFHQTDSRLEMALNALEADSDGTDYVRVEMAKVAVIETKIQGITDLYKAKQVGSIELHSSETLMLFRSHGRMSISRIAIVLGVEIRADYFGTSGPAGMATRHGVLTSSGNSNMLKMG